jgi:hypothetical protein
MTSINGCSSAEWGRHGQERARLFAIPAGGGSGFIGGEKRVLYRCIREAGVVLTAQAQARLDALPEQFLDFIVAPVSFTVQMEAEAA